MDFMFYYIFEDTRVFGSISNSEGCVWGGGVCVWRVCVGGVCVCVCFTFLRVKRVTTGCIFPIGYSVLLP